MALTDFEIEFKRAVELRHRGLTDEAIEIFRKLLETSQHRASVLGMIGGLYLFDKESPTDALPFLEESAKLAPKSEMASVCLFHAFWNLNRTDDAFNEMKRFLALRDSEEYQRLLAEINESD